MGVTLVLLITIPLITKVLLSNVFGDFWFVALFIAMCIPMFGMCYLTTSAKTKDLEIIGDLHYICREATERNPGIKFILKRDRVYQEGSTSVAMVKFILVQDENAAGGQGSRPRTPDTLGSSDDVRTQSSAGGSSLHVGQEDLQYYDEGPDFYNRLRLSIARVDADYQV